MRSAWFGYGLAVLGAATAAAIRWELGKLVGQDLPPFITFYPVVILSALFGGTGAGLLATVISDCVVSYLFLSPVGSLAVERTADVAGLAIFTTVNLMMSFVGGALRRAWHREQAVRLREEAAAGEMAETLGLLDMACVLALDLNGRIVRWSEGCKRRYGYSQSEALSRRYFELLQTRAPEPFDKIRAALLQKEHWSGEMMHKAADGREIVSHCEWNLWRNHTGQPTAILVSATDITQNRKAQEQLRLQSAALGATAEGVVITDRNGIIQWVNAAFEKSTGYTRQEAIGQNPRLLKSGRHSREFYQRLWKTVLGGQTWQGEMCNRRKDGSCYDEEMSITPVRNERGEVSHFVAIKRDVTLRKQAEDALRASEERYRLLFEHMLDGFALCRVIFDADRRAADFVYVEVNPAFSQITGLADVVGKRVTEVFPHFAQDYPEVLEAYGGVAAGGPPTRFELDFKSLGKWFSIAVHCPRPGHVGVVFTDITQRRQAELEVRETRDQLAQVNLALENIVQDRTAELRKSVGELEHFSYSITHDMRAPLRAMRSYCSLLLKGNRSGMTAEEKGWLDNIAVSAERMDQLILDALDYAKAARETLPLEPVDVDALVRGMLRSYPAFHPAVAKIEIEGKLPVVIGNRAALTQSFSNLLNNAVKFVQPGQMPQVRLWAERTDGRVRLWVEDKGIGIAKEHHERIFQMFQRLSLDYEGTGIGLALVRKVAEKMNGRVGVASEPGHGSRFWLELEAAAEVGIREAA